ncbi:hypothetical protein ACHAWX_000172 [Stephanocyclus meneghinianus]
MDNPTPPITTASQQQQQASILSLRYSQNILGALCTDPNGLCLGYRGDISPSLSGVFCAIAKLASQLDGGNDGNSNGSDGGVPTVIIQTENSAMLIKEYHGGRTVVFRVPVENDGGNIHEGYNLTTLNQG